MPKGIYLHKPRSEESKRKTSDSLKKRWSIVRKGKTFAEIFGPEKAKAMKEKMSYAKLGRKMPWNKGYQGSEHPRWIADRTKVVGRHNRGFHDSDYRQWHKNVMIRDGSKCKISNLWCEGRIEVHHIFTWKEKPELRYKIINGIALCHAHHPRRRAEEKRLASYFQDLVSVSR